jgi:hypothetical protein
LGAYYFPSRLWDRFYWSHDLYSLAVPPDLPSGVYEPRLGVYRFERLEQLPVISAAGEPVESTVRLAPLKVVSTVAGRPAQRLGAQFAGLGQLVGYTMEPRDGIRAGSTLTLTVYYRAQGGDPRNLHEFVHLYEPSLGLAAQHDGLPQQGGNPTWAWLADEVIESVIPLVVDPAAAPGQYALLLGFYDPALNNTRVPVSDPQGQRWINDVIVLTTIALEP